MAEEKTLSINTDPVFLEELSEYLEILANPLRLKILKFIEREPREITAIAEYTGMSYQNTKKHLDRLVGASLAVRTAGFGRETERGIAPVWKYSLAPGSLENITRTLGVFSSIADPMGYSDILGRIRSVRAELFAGGRQPGPVLYLIGGPADGRAFILTGERIFIGRADPENPAALSGNAIVLPEEYRSVTRVTKPHAVLTRTGGSWYLEDNSSTGGTYLNSRRLGSSQRVALGGGDVIDLSTGTSAARFLFVTDE